MGTAPSTPGLASGGREPCWWPGKRVGRFCTLLAERPRGPANDHGTITPLRVSTKRLGLSNLTLKSRVTGKQGLVPRNPVDGLGASEAGASGLGHSGNVGARADVRLAVPGRDRAGLLSGSGFVRKYSSLVPWNQLESPPCYDSALMAFGSQ